MKPLTILEIGTTDTKGGAALVSWNLKKEFEKAGHHVSMIVGYKRSQDPTVRDIYNTPINHAVSHLVHRNVRSRFQAKAMYFLANDISFLPGKKIITFPEFTSADIIQAHNLHSGFFNLKALPALSQAKPFVWTLHDMWPLTGYPAHTFDCPHWPYSGCSCQLPNSLPPLGWNNTRHLWRLKHKIYQHAKLTLVAPSQWMKKNIEKSMLADKPVQVIYNGVDTTLFRPQDKKIAREKLQLPVDKKIVLFASKGGTKNIWKGWQFAEQVIQRYRPQHDIIFVCLGGYDTPELLPNVQAVNYVTDQNQLALYYAAADFLLYPSVADNCPLTVLESLACGVPVLAFDTGGIPELVAHRTTGYVAAYKNSEDLKSGFDWLMNLTDAEQKNMALLARQTIERTFTTEHMAEQYLQLYSSLIQ